jgi:MFS family permease
VTDEVDTKSGATTWYPWLVLAGSFYLMVAGTGSVYLLVAALKPIATEFDWPRTVPSMAYALQYLGGGIGGIVMGYWLDRAGMMRPALLGAVMIGVGACLTRSIENAWQLYAIYGLMFGLAGRATLFSPLMVNISRWFDGRRGMAVGIVGSGQAVAGAMWPAVFQWGIESIGWRDTAFAYGIFVLLTMIPVSLVFVRKSPPIADAALNANNPTLASTIDPTRFTAALCIAIIGCCTAMSLPLAHLMSHASDVGHSSLDGARLLSVMLICAAFSSMVVLGQLVRKFGALRSLMVFSATQAVTLGLFPLADSLTGLYVVAALFGFGYGGVLPSYPIIVRENIGAQGAGARTGLVVFFGTIGMALGSGLGGLSYDLSQSYTPAFYAGVMLNAANIGVLALLWRATRRI